MFLQKFPIAAVEAAVSLVRLPQLAGFQAIPSIAKAPTVAGGQRGRQRADHSRYQAQCRRAMSF